MRCFCLFELIYFLLITPNVIYNNKMFKAYDLDRDNSELNTSRVENIYESY